jgi:hypothetical protein
MHRTGYRRSFGPPSNRNYSTPAQTLQCSRNTCPIRPFRAVPLIKKILQSVDPTLADGLHPLAGVSLAIRLSISRNYPTVTPCLLDALAIGFASIFCVSLVVAIIPVACVFKLAIQVEGVTRYYHSLYLFNTLSESTRLDIPVTFYPSPPSRPSPPPLPASAAVGDCLPSPATPL